jgi:hypothetical protein
MELKKVWHVVGKLSITKAVKAAAAIEDPSLSTVPSNVLLPDEFASKLMVSLGGPMHPTVMVKFSFSV